LDHHSSRSVGTPHRVCARRAHSPATRGVVRFAAARLGAALLSAALLAACSSGGTVTIADSQSSNTQSGTASTDYAIAYVKRTVPVTTTGKVTTMAQDDLRLPRQYFTTADLYLRNPANAGGTEVNITHGVTGGANYDIKDVDVAYDGSSILFAMRGPLTAKQKDFDPPNWSIWEYVIASNYLHQICPITDPTCTASQYLSPHYLPDGRILFATTRQFDSGSVLLNEDKPEFEGQTEDLDESAFVLHVMNPDGSGLHQISFNQSHDTYATVLQNGRVMFTRWDHANGNDGMELYTSNPDGTNVQLLYGFGSHVTASTNPDGAASCPAGEDCTVEFVSTREMEDGSILALVRPYTNADFGGNLMIINAQHYTENNQANPDTPNNSGYSTTTVAEAAATENPVLTQVNTTTNLPMISPGGRFSSAFPLWDGSGRILVTWTECRLQNTTGTILPCTSANLANTTLTEAPVLYSAWMFDPSDDTFLPITTPTEGVFVDDIVALQPRASAPQYIADSYTATTPPQGIVDIRSVYDWDGAACNGQNGESCNVTALGGIAGVAQLPADQRPVRFLRVLKAVSIPPAKAAMGDFALNFDRNTAFGSAGNYMREVEGYVPIEPDGSVRVSVPAYIAFQLDVVDVDPASGHVWRAFPLHAAWLQLLPGEEIDCNGCHLPAAQQRPPAGVSTYSHGNATLFASVWGGSQSGAPFPGTTTGPGITTQPPPCKGETMAEALVGYGCGSTPTAASTLSVNVTFNDPWFGGGAGNESFSFSYDDPTLAGVPIPTALQCAVSGGDGGDDCRIVLNYPTTPPMTATVPVSGNVEPIWSQTRVAPGGGDGTCSDCHNASTAATAYLDLATGASADNANVENSYEQLMNGFSVTTVDPVTGQTVTTQVRGAEFNSGDAAGSHFFQVFTNPADPAYATHTGLLSPAEMRLLSEWVDIGAQYYNNPFNAPLQN
jgi:hypothetical protein